MNGLPTSMDEVLKTLDTIIQETIDDGNYLGIFAYVYRRTTAEIKRAVDEKQFEDNPAMARFDVLFANLYIQAYFNYKAGKKTSHAWELSFHAKHEPLLIMQHLILGMNAHINLDLGIAAARFAPGDRIQSIKIDFMKVNQILKNLTDEIQEKITRVSKLMFLLDWIGKEKDEIAAGFSIKKARNFAWMTAEHLAPITDPIAQEKAIQEVDKKVTAIGKIVHHPAGKILTWLINVIRMFEEKDVKVILEKLAK
ncbi:MAG: hypothetical protein ACI94Y_001463 [Maribacter sp.]|jgi:hypothetical protein